MITAALLGAGSRGRIAYGSYALKYPKEIQFVAVAEPDQTKRKLFAEEHNIPKEMQFTSWEELLTKPKLAEALLICTQDRDHFKPTMKALELGYDILLEKPMSPDPYETLQMAEKAEETKQLLTICHVLRYSTFFIKLKEILADKERLGDIVNIEWTEKVGYYHQAHSFVRGNWRNSEESSSMLLQKCCHDIDLIQWLLDEPCQKVCSFGSLTYFRKEHAPKGAGDRCIDCAIEPDCPYSAIKWYYHDRDEWPVNTIEPTGDLKKRWEALEESRYGVCVYKSDNNVVDHQVVNLEFESGATVAFTMTAFTKEQGRTFRIGTTKAEITGSTLSNEIRIQYYEGGETILHPAQVSGGHGGADTLIMRDFIQQVKNKSLETKTSALESAKSHLIVFAAEKSRLEEKTIFMDDYIASLKKK